MDSTSDEDEAVEVVYKCRKCSYTSDSAEEIKQHAKNEHKKKQDTKIKETGVDHCGAEISNANEGSENAGSTLIPAGAEASESYFESQFPQQNSEENDISSGNNNLAADETLHKEQDAAEIGHNDNLIEQNTFSENRETIENVIGIEQKAVTGVINNDTENRGFDDFNDIQENMGNTSTENNIILQFERDADLLNVTSEGIPNTEDCTEKPIFTVTSEASLTAGYGSNDQERMVTNVSDQGLAVVSQAAQPGQDLFTGTQKDLVMVTNLDQGMVTMVHLDEEISNGASLEGMPNVTSAATEMPGSTVNRAFASIAPLNQDMDGLQTLDQGLATTAASLVTTTFGQTMAVSNSLNSDIILNKFDDALENIHPQHDEQNLMYFVDTPLSQTGENVQFIDMENQGSSLSGQEYLDREEVGNIQEGSGVVQIIDGTNQLQDGVDIMVGPTGQRFVLLTNNDGTGQRYMTTNQIQHPGLSTEFHGTTNVTDGGGLVSFADGVVSDESGLVAVPLGQASDTATQFTTTLSQPTETSMHVTQIGESDMIVSEGYQASYQNFIQQTGQTDESEFAVPGWISQADLESGNYQITETKELFLCGQCNMSFISMEQCKAHIEQKHHLEEEGTDISQQQISGNKCSIGVQACRGPPRGRVRKKPAPVDLISDKEDEPKVLEAEIEKEQEELAQEVGEDDEFRTDLQGGRTRNKRRIKTPKHLLDEYFIGKKKPGGESPSESTTSEKQPFNWDEIGLKPKKNKRKMIVNDRAVNEQNKGDVAAESGKEEKTAATEQKTQIQDFTKAKEPASSDDERDQEYKPSRHELNQQSEDDIHSAEENEVASPPKKRVRRRAKVDQRKPHKERLLRGERLVPKFEIAEELKTPKHKYTIHCKIKTCRAKFISQEAYEYHLTCHRGPKGRVTLVCSVCERDFNAWSSCKYHLWREHKVDLDLYGCEMCSFKTDMACKMDVHKVVHLQERPYICNECGRGFKQPGQLRNHEVLHEQIQMQEGDEEAWFQKKKCDYCDNEFANSKSLKKHIVVVHGKLRPFSCPQCEHTASSRAALQIHLRIHTGEKPYSCDLCKFTASDHNTLRRHRMRHTGEKPYVCPHCPYSSIQAVALKSHLKKKHSDSPGIYGCKLCEFTTINQGLYNTHMADHDRGLPTASNTGRRGRGRGAAIAKSVPKPLTKYACAKCLFSTPDMSQLVAHLGTCPAKFKQPLVTTRLPSQSILKQAVSAAFGVSSNNIVMDQTHVQATGHQLAPSRLRQPIIFSHRSNLTTTYPVQGSPTRFVIKSGPKGPPQTVVLTTQQSSGDLVINSEQMRNQLVTVKTLPQKCSSAEVDSSQAVDGVVDTSFGHNDNVIHVQTVPMQAVGDKPQNETSTSDQVSVSVKTEDNSKLQILNYKSIEGFDNEQTDSTSTNAHLHHSTSNSTLETEQKETFTNIITDQENQDEPQAFSNEVIDNTEMQLESEPVIEEQGESEKAMDIIQSDDGTTTVECTGGNEELLQSLQEEGAFVYAEDGSLQPVNLSELTSGQMVKGIQQQENGELHLIVESLHDD